MKRSATGLTGIRRLAIVAIVAAGLALMAGSAHATFPGRNGPIAFRRYDPATGLGVPLLRANPDGSGVTVLSELPGFFSDWSPDGRGIAFDFFDQQGNEHIATIDADGTNLQVLTPASVLAEAPSWSPDASRIVFDASEQPPGAAGFQTRLWTMNADGTNQQLLPMTNPGFDVEPKYSPDGRWIAFDRLIPKGPRSQLQAVFIVPAQGGTARQLTDWGLLAEHPTWSPDSQWIAFDADSGFRVQGTIEIMRPDGSDQTVVLTGTGLIGGHKPWFSPDGTKILFVCDFSASRHIVEDICVMNADGTQIIDLTNTPDTHENWPSWGVAPIEG